MIGSDRDASRLSRRAWMWLASAGVLEGSASGWIETLAASAAADPKRLRSCLLLWMTGGPSLTDTGPEGMTIKDRPVAVPDLLATVWLALGIAPSTGNDSNVGRPIRVVDPRARPIQEVLG